MELVAVFTLVPQRNRSLTNYIEFSYREFLIIILFIILPNEHIEEHLEVRCE